MTKKEISGKERTNEERELAIRLIIDRALVSDEMLDIFEAVGRDKSNISILDDTFINEMYR
ncbi:MAG: DUF3387 domain-containing protein [Chlorobiaceae bacterium]|nr:DUF3387 domain-containing protein [Chlorobiaceae bacterium]